MQFQIIYYEEKKNSAGKNKISMLLKCILIFLLNFDSLLNFFLISLKFQYYLILLGVILIILGKITVDTLLEGNTCKNILFPEVNFHNFIKERKRC